MKKLFLAICGIAAFCLCGVDYPAWMIGYTNYSGVESRAVEFLYGALGDQISRIPGVYSLPTLKCEKVITLPGDTNAIIIGTRRENPLLQKFFTEAEIPAHGFRVKLIEHPQFPERQLLLIAGDTPAAVFYGACTFFDDILPSFAPDCGNRIRYVDKLFAGKLTNYDIFRAGEKLPALDYVSAPKTLIRSVFTWGHPIGNYREYLRNLARCKVNRVYLWNEYPPLNAAEVVDYAHSYGIEVFWGFAWGWSTDCARTDLGNLPELSENIYRQWRDVWNKLPGDGIYFQSFTELHADKINGKSVAECVVDLVNTTAARIWRDRPELKIVFGLHASSVREQLEVISRTERRMEILWEDCGKFPYTHFPVDDYRADDDFTAQLIAMKRPMGLVYKAQLMQEWRNFAHQSGVYILGANGEKVRRHDVEVTTPLWREYQALWHENGRRAYELTRTIQSRSAEIELNLAAQLNGPINFPTALVFELFWDSSRSFAEIQQAVLRRNYVRH